jgi:hypothetical protein
MHFRISEWSKHREYGYAMAVDPFRNRSVFVHLNDMPGHVRPMVGTIIDCVVSRERHGPADRWRATCVKVVSE